MQALKKTDLICAVSHQLLKDTLHQLRGKREHTQDPAKGDTDAKQTHGDSPVTDSKENNKDITQTKQYAGWLQCTHLCH